MHHQFRPKFWEMLILMNGNFAYSNNYQFIDRNFKTIITYVQMRNIYLNSERSTLL